MASRFRIAEIKSSTSNNKYILSILADEEDKYAILKSLTPNKLQCSCLAWTRTAPNGHGIRKPCKHINRFIEALNLPLSTNAMKGMGIVLLTDDILGQKPKLDKTVENNKKEIERKKALWGVLVLFMANVADILDKTLPDATRRAYLLEID